jgi:hypothetical protein
VLQNSDSMLSQGSLPTKGVRGIDVAPPSTVVRPNTAQRFSPIDVNAAQHPDSGRPAPRESRRERLPCAE